jgi:tetratricopeptide (TPR) repeat protein
MLAAVRQTRSAVAGRAHDSDRGTPASVIGGSARGGSRSASDRGSRVLRAPAPPPPKSGGSQALLIGGAIGVAVLVAGGVLASRYLGGAPAAAPSQAPEVQNLAKAVIDTQVELARRRLDAGDFTDAARKAEGALKLDPQSAAAKEVLDAANKGLKQVETALEAVQAAGNDRERLATAAFELMSVDPGRPEAAKAANAAGPAFRAKVDDAKALSHQERQKAEQAGADRASSFAQGVDLERQGDRALEGGQLATAARRYLEARGRFAEATSSHR